VASSPANEDEIMLLWACQAITLQYHFFQRGNIFIYSMGWSQKPFIIQMVICYSRQFTNQVSGWLFLLLCGQLSSSSGYFMCKANSEQLKNAYHFLGHHIVSVNRSNGMTFVHHSHLFVSASIGGGCRVSCMSQIWGCHC